MNAHDNAELFPIQHRVAYHNIIQVMQDQFTIPGVRPYGGALPRTVRRDIDSWAWLFSPQGVRHWENVP